MTPRRTKIYFDGGCRPNPGRMAIAVATGGTVQIDRDVGAGGSMDAEWLALIAALRLARARELGSFLLMGDALAVIGPATGRIACRAGYRHYLAEFRALAEAGPKPAIRHIKRTQNLAGIALDRALEYPIICC